MRDRKGASAQTEFLAGGRRARPSKDGDGASTDPLPSEIGPRGRKVGRPRIDPAERRQRTTFDFTPATIEIIERVRQRTNSASANEAIRKAINLLDRHLDEVEAGARAVYERTDGTRAEIVVV